MHKNARTINNFCEAYDVSRSLLYRQWREGKGPERIKVGGRVLIAHEAGERWLAEQAHQGSVSQ